MHKVAHQQELQEEHKEEPQVAHPVVHRDQEELQEEYQEEQELREAFQEEQELREEQEHQEDHEDHQYYQEDEDVYGKDNQRRHDDASLERGAGITTFSLIFQWILPSVTETNTPVASVGSGSNGWSVINFFSSFSRSLHSIIRAGLARLNTGWFAEEFFTV